ncbi:hypothetical protein QG37_04637 [Candidozyma auris]|uniref:Uncharacterized protein n=1 Tax=Candidozyma auris TaxID=498019 RepID=A0A0L0NXM3_CANAR|nr:hypothetical protein QG37_04637 [[Candida] auris]
MWLSQSFVGIAGCKRRAKMAAKWPQNGLKVASKWPQSGSKVLYWTGAENGHYLVV